MDRGYGYLLSNIASVLARMDRIPEAIAALDQYIDVHPRATAKINRAVLLARIGKDESAIRDLREAVATSNEPKVNYQAACVHALLLPRKKGSRTRALSLLANALLAGYGIHDVEADPDLDALRDDEGFKALLKTVALSQGPPRGQKNSRSDPQSPHRDDPEPSPQTLL